MIKRDPVNEHKHGVPEKGNTTKVTISITASNEALLTSNTMYRVSNTEACHLAFTTSGEEVNDADMFLNADEVNYFSTDSDNIYCAVSGIAGGTAGVLYLTDLDPVHDWIKR